MRSSRDLFAGVIASVEDGAGHPIREIPGRVAAGTWSFTKSVSEIKFGKLKQFGSNRLGRKTYAEDDQQADADDSSQGVAGNQTEESAEEDPEFTTTPEEHTYKQRAADEDCRYEYNQTELTRSNFIRLLELLPGSLEEPVRCRLVCRDLQDIPEYEALSYVWGDSKDILPIEVDGRVHETAPATVRCALRHLRYEDRPRLLWADSLCINQTDEEEKAKQIALMRQIYVQASQTVVWLGPAYRTSRQAISYMSLYGKANLLENAGVPLSKMPKIIAKEAEEDLEWVKAHLTDPQAMWRSDDVWSLFLAPWWRRSWCLQEIVLATKAQLVCGRDTLDWEEFRQGFLYGLKHDCFALKALNTSWDHEIRNISSVVSPLDIAQLESNDRADVLLATLQRHMTRNATLPQDKIFSVFGLVPDTDKLGLEPDYHATASEIYKRVTVQILKHSTTLNVLATANSTAKLSIPASDGSEALLQSWVADWRSFVPMASRPTIQRTPSSIEQLTLGLYKLMSRQTSGSGRIKEPNRSHSEDTSKPVSRPDFGKSWPGLTQLTHNIASFTSRDTAEEPETLATPESGVLLAKQELTVAEYPSWRMVEVKIPIPLSVNDDGSERPNFATNGSVSEIAFTNDGSSLILQGFVFDELAETSVLMPSQVEADWHSCLTDSNLLADSYSELDAIDYNADWQVIAKRVWALESDLCGWVIKCLFWSIKPIEAFIQWERFAGVTDGTGTKATQYWRTITAGELLSNAVGAYEETQREFLAWYKTLAKLRSLVSWHLTRPNNERQPMAILGYLWGTWQAASPFSNLLQRTEKRRLAKTRSGRLALVPPGAEAGDKLTLCKGGKVPLAMRKKNDGGWTFIGETYVHDVMDGKAFRPELCYSIRLD